MDSGQPTASGGVDTKCSKHDMNDSATDTDGGGLKMFNSGNNQRKLNLRIQNTSPRDSILNLNKKFELTIH